MSFIQTIWIAVRLHCSQRYTVKGFLSFFLLFSLVINASEIQNELKLNSSSNAHLGLVKLQIDNGLNSFSTDIYFNTNASLGLDPGYDASLYGGVAPNFSVYSLLVEQNTGMPMGIQALGENDMNGTIVPIGIHAPEGENITVRLTESTIPPSVSIYLEDTLTGGLTLLNTNNYIFIAQENITTPGRFFLRFDADVLNVLGQDLRQLKIHSDLILKKIIIEGPLNNSTGLNLYNMNGSMILSKKLDESSSYNELDINGLTAGIYVIRLCNKSGAKRTRKLYIN